LRISLGVKGRHAVHSDEVGAAPVMRRWANHLPRWWNNFINNTN
jgi:hypothetical protein